MTPQRIADISEPIEQLYGDLTDELLINIAKHLSKATATWSALHEIETLQEMGQLTEENIKIINDYVKRMPQEIKDAMNESRLEALGEIEKKLADAAADGYLTQPVTDGTVEVAQALSNQAAEQLNLVNQTMLNSSLQAYQTGVYEFRQEMNNLAIKTIETEQQLELAQTELNKAAGQVVAGTENRTKALRKCIRKLNDAGIVGYYDRLNRAWTAEAYVNMNIRTTVHNTYIQSIKTRQQEYGTDVFQVSSHAGARSCTLLQGLSGTAFPEEPGSILAEDPGLTTAEERVVLLVSSVAPLDESSPQAQIMATEDAATIVLKSLYFIVPLFTPPQTRQFFPKIYSVLRFSK